MGESSLPRFLITTGSPALYLDEQKTIAKLGFKCIMSVSKLLFVKFTRRSIVDELKKLVVAEVIKVTRSMLATAQEGRTNAIEESKYHKGAMESRYDSFKEEAQYLMVAQDVRIGELNSTIFALGSLLARPYVANGKARTFSLIELEDDAGNLALYLILPAGGGVTCNVNEKTVTTINESSPLARAVLGKSEGEETELEIAGNHKTFTIVTIT